MFACMFVMPANKFEFYIFVNACVKCLYFKCSNLEAYFGKILNFFLNLTILQLKFYFTRTEKRNKPPIYAETKVLFDVFKKPEKVVVYLNRRPFIKNCSNSDVHRNSNLY